MHLLLEIGSIVGIAALVACGVVGVVIVAAFASWMNNGSH